jgi:hypothetical protein
MEHLHALPIVSSRARFWKLLCRISSVLTAAVHAS